MNDPIVYVLVRTDLNMSRGKMCAQAGHAVTLIMLSASESDLREWVDPVKGNMKKVVLAVGNLASLDVIKEFPNRGFIVHDAGATEIDKGSATCAGVGIVDKSDPVVKKFLGGLQPLR